MLVHTVAWQAEMCFLGAFSFSVLAACCLSCSKRYVKGLITMSAPFGGTTDQAITVRMGAVEWNINEWVKNPISRIAKDLAAHAKDMARALEEDEAAFERPAVSLAARRVSRRVSNIAGAINHRGGAAGGADGDDKVSTATSLPKPINNMVKNYISSAFFKVTMGLPGLAMLLPYPSAYGAWRRIVVTRKRTYTASMMKRLMSDIGDSVTQHAWNKVQELDRVLAKGQIPGVSTHCMYGKHGVSIVCAC